MDVGFIGAGKTGCALGRYFVERGLFVAGYSDTNRKAAERAASSTNSLCFDSLSSLADTSDVIFITVPDSAIATAWHELCAQSGPGALKDKHPDRDYSTWDSLIGKVSS